jgi:hypothetical protein
MQGRAQSGNIAGRDGLREAGCDARLLDRLPDRGDARGGILQRKAMLDASSKRQIGLVDRAARENQGIGRKAHRRRALQHQHLGRAALPRVAQEDKRRGGPCADGRFIRCPGDRAARREFLSHALP